MRPWESIAAASTLGGRRPRTAESRAREPAGLDLVAATMRAAVYHGARHPRRRRAVNALRRAKCSSACTPDRDEGLAAGVREHRAEPVDVIAVVIEHPGHDRSERDRIVAFVVTDT